MSDLSDRYPNLTALSKGCVSGRISEWPLLRIEARDLLGELDRLTKTVEHLASSNERFMFRVAQDITDQVLGKGSYVKLNGFDPSKGETYKGDKI